MNAYLEFKQKLKKLFEKRTAEKTNEEIAGTIEVEQVKLLRKQWGNQPCDHPAWLMETRQGISTSDYVCAQCGRSIYDPKQDEDRNIGEKHI